MTSSVCPTFASRWWPASFSRRSSRCSNCGARPHARTRRNGPTDADKQIALPAPGLALKHLLTGLVRCGLCDRSMRPMSSGRSSKEGKKLSVLRLPGCPRGDLRQQALRARRMAAGSSRGESPLPAFSLRHSGDLVTTAASGGVILTTARVGRSFPTL